ncbi:hypothetical protein [Halobacillus litoralis]|uniref:hypothetical protein n=1 Tax=Halobacillus litoralis TaxID=45668 RepID=UPI0024922582|nr:hypothetical protein [Halobacillus litoralis]
MSYMDKTNKVMEELISGKRGQFGNYSYHQSRFTDGKADIPEWEVRRFILNYFLTLDNLKKNA